MQALVRREPVRNLRVTIQTFQRSLATKFVATGAVRRSVERLVRARQRSGRNLRRGGWHCDEASAEKNRT